MSDDREDPLAGLGDLDWDSALDEWEQKSFTPEVARDAEADRALAEESAKFAEAEAPALPNKPPPPISAAPPADEAIPSSDPALKARPDGTLIAQVPRELRNDPPLAVKRTSVPPPVAPARPTLGSTPPRTSAPPPLSAPPRISAPPARASAPPARASAPAPRASMPPTRGGGLNQLFSRPPPKLVDPAANEKSAGGPPRPLPPVPRAPSEKTRVAPSASSLEEIASTKQRESDRTLVGVEVEAPDSSPPTAPAPSVRPKAISESTADALEATLVGKHAIADASTVESPAVDPGREDVATIASRSFAAALVTRRDDEDNATIVRDRDDDDEHENATVVRDRASFVPPPEARPSTGTKAASPIEEDRAAQRHTARLPSASEYKPPIEPPPLPPQREEDNERAGSRWLDAEKTRAFASRVDWLEEEARSVADPIAQARALLAVSELCATVGDRERAHALATEARDLAPKLALAWRQARQLAPHDPDLLAEALDAEASQSPTPSARAHAVLLSADVLRLSGRGDAAVERWDRACKLDPADTRGPIARAALALAQDDHTSGSLRLADNSELVALDKAVRAALRLRGVERPGAAVDDVLINDGLRHARAALVAGDVVAAAQSTGELATVPELSKGALWLSAALGSGHIASRRAAARALKTLVSDGDDLARRQLAARGIELGDPELVAFALSDSFDAAERAVLGILGTRATSNEAEPREPSSSIEGGSPHPLEAASAATIAALAEDEAMAALVDALSALSPVPATAEEDEDAATRASRVAGKDDAAALATLGRLLASNASGVTLDSAVARVSDVGSASAGGVAIETAVRAKRWDELSEALSRLPSSDDSAGAAQRHIAAAIVAERAKSNDRAKEAWAEAARTDAVATDGLLRIAAELDGEYDLGAELLLLADTMPDGVPAAIVRLEGLARCRDLDDDEQAAILERVHRAAPNLGVGAFLAERLGRRHGDLDEVLRWIQERRSYATDPLETALDAVREAFLVADRDPELASTRLEEAHRARPDDVALRDLYERLAPEPPADRGTWREARAAANDGSTLLWIEAALEHERAGDPSASLRAARKAAESGDRGLSGPMVERLELAAGDTTRQTDELIEVTKTTEDHIVRREAFERLAELDAFGKNDPAAALLWHRAILEGTPRHKPSLRWVEHALIGEGRDDELAGTFEQIAIALDGSHGGETSAHAQHAARLRVREAQANGSDVAGSWEKTHDMARLAATQPEPSLWSLRALNAHARSQKDDAATLTTTLALLERTQRAPERAALLLRASEAAARLEKVADARAYLEQAANEDPGDVVTWGLLADVRQRAGETREAAEACEALARTSVVRDHQLLAWHDASKLWLDEVKDSERAMSALEAAAEIDVTYADVFPRLSALYTSKNLDAELARLLERRLDSVDDENERVALEVELSRAFADMGEIAKAKIRLQSALDKRPDHTTALGAMADLCVKEGDWPGAEHALVRLARLLSEPAEQRAIYERLGEIYSVHAPNLARAEVALKEVLKRSPNDRGVLARLVEIHMRQGDVQKAALAQQEIVAAETDPNARLASLIDLAKIHETVGRDPRRSEQVLDSARKEFPTSVVALRAMAEFYSRQRQMPAMQILLDRAAGDARRAFAQGRFVPSLFQVLHAAFELRGKRDAARVVAATLAAVEGEPSDLVGGEAGAVDPRLDDLLAPELMSPALRTLLFRAGDALDAVTPVDLRAVKAVPLQPGTPIGATVGSVATVIGLGALQILVSPVLGRVALPLATNPPTLLVGEGLAKVKNERARMFVVVRALKMILARSSSLLRAQPTSEVEKLVAGLFNAFNPSYFPQGMDAKKVTELSRRVGPALPRNLDPTVGVIALEAAGMIGTQWSKLGDAVHGWANRVALLAVGDPNAALDAIAWSLDEDEAPKGSEERAAWIARHPQARDLMTFSVTDAYAEARIQLSLER